MTQDTIKQIEKARRYMGATPSNIGDATKAWNARSPAKVNATIERSERCEALLEQVKFVCETAPASSIHYDAWYDAKVRPLIKAIEEWQKGNGSDE